MPAESIDGHWKSILQYHAIDHPHFKRTPMLSQRLITGPILIASLLGLVWLDTVVAGTSLGGGVVLCTLFAGVLIPLAAWEAAQLTMAWGVSISPLPTIALSLWMLGVTVASGIITDPQCAITFTLLGPAVTLALALILSAWGGRVDGAWIRASSMLGISIWIGLLGAFWILAARTHSTWLVAGILLTVKLGDIGAYFTGISIGRHKLIPWLSPGKTYEGLFGGMIFSGLGGFGLAMISQSAMPENSLSLIAGAVGGVLLALTGALGDLAESLLKRAAKAKDSGTCIPGMGGILDVIDSPLAAGPIAYLLLMWGTSAS